jgi:arylamine N-acetyltransferase
MLEALKGDQAAHILLSHLKIRRAAGSSWRPAEAGPALDTLRGLPYLRGLAGHFAEFPYENISKILKAAEAPTLPEAMRFPTEVVTDHIERGFGGTCFSLTFLFERLLASLGFDCYKVMADMRSGENVHCLVVVREGGAKYIVDPGYALYEVMALPGSGAASASRERVSCPHATVEIETGGDGRYDLWTEDAAGRKWRYRFADRPAADAEFERHWLASFGKPTLRNICLTRMTPRGHIYLRRDFFKFTSSSAVEKRHIKTGRERLVEEEFGIGGEWLEAAQRVLDQRAALRGAGLAGDMRAAGNGAATEPGAARSSAQGRKCVRG